MIPTITSLQNPRVKQAVKLRDRRTRDELQMIIVDGIREISRALGAGVEPLELFYLDGVDLDEASEDILYQADRMGATILPVSRAVMEKMAFGDRAEQVLLVARYREAALAKLLADRLSGKNDLLVAVIEGVEKPGNLGAILRSADAAGVAAVIVCDARLDLMNPNAIRASLGAIFTVPVVRASIDETLAWLRGNSFRILATRVDGAVNYTQADFRQRTAVLLGSEAEGLTSEWSGDDIQPISLPMLGVVDSLNLSVTAGIIFYEALRQRAK